MKRAIQYILIYLLFYITMDMMNERNWEFNIPTIISLIVNALMVIYLLTLKRTKVYELNKD
jgi:uncharacterized membrane protein